MKISSAIKTIFALFAASSFLGLAACNSDKHTMVDPQAGSVMVCKECYNEVYKVQHPTGSRYATQRTQEHLRHACLSCKTEMSIYTENGVTMVKCAKCAPEGMACDRCLPPKNFVPPDVTSTK